MTEFEVIQELSAVDGDTERLAQEMGESLDRGPIEVMKSYLDESHYLVRVHDDE